MPCLLIDDLMTLQQNNLKKFLKRMLAGFEELMNKVDSTIPHLTNTLNRRGEEIDKMIEEFPILNTQQRDLSRRLDACVNEQEI